MTTPTLSIDFKKLIKVQTDFEDMLLNLPNVQQGLHYSVEDQKGHPEKIVGFHVMEVLDNINSLALNHEIYLKLRIVALIHDTFKHEEAQTKKAGKRIHHGIIAKDFLKNYLSDHVVLNLIAKHDEPFYAWQDAVRYKNPSKAKIRLEKLEEIFQDDLELLYLFYRCDTMTGNKTLEPLSWFEYNLQHTKFYAYYR